MYHIFVKINYIFGIGYNIFQLLWNILMLNNRVDAIQYCIVLGLSMSSLFIWYIILMTNDQFDNYHRPIIQTQYGTWRISKNFIQLLYHITCLCSILCTGIMIIMIYFEAAFGWKIFWTIVQTFQGCSSYAFLGQFVYFPNNINFHNENINTLVESFGLNNFKMYELVNNLPVSSSANNNILIQAPIFSRQQIISYLEQTQDKETDKEDHQCILCCSNQRCIVFGCGHKNTCANCSLKLINQNFKCPICIIPIHNVIYSHPE